MSLDELREEISILESTIENLHYCGTENDEIDKLYDNFIDAYTELCGALEKQLNTLEIQKLKEWRALN